MSFNPAEHMISLKGKEYLQVMWRLVWFREECPLWSIDTQFVSHDTETKHAVFRAVISDENGVPKSSAYGSESARDFGDYIEKAETKAVGRALAMLGYGTQFSPELDEGERIVDSPVQRTPVAVNAPSPVFCGECGATITATTSKTGKAWSAEDIAYFSKKKFGRVLCPDCQRKEKTNA